MTLSLFSVVLAFAVVTAVLFLAAIAFTAVTLLALTSALFYLNQRENHY